MKDFALKDDGRDLLALWYGAREGDDLPPKRFIDPLKLRRWIGSISVVHLHEGEKRFYIALHGADVARHLGPDFNRKYLEDVIPEAAKEDAYAPYELSMRTGLPSYSIQMRNHHNGLFKNLERMVMPCAGTDPARAERFLVWVPPIESSAMESTSVYVPFAEDEFEPIEQDDHDGSSALFLLSDDWL